MGKAGNARRRRIFAELEAQGKIVKVPRRPKKVKTPKPEPVVVETTGCYCLDKYSNDLPSGFRQCYGCPLDSAALVI